LLFRLSLMMFLQYAVWGAWLPLAARFLSAGPEEGGLGFTGGQIGLILGLAGSLGAIAAPFLAGQFADRYFRTERVLAALLLVGGVVKWVTSFQTSYTAWLWLSIAYSIVYMPTLALTNSLAFYHLRDGQRDFPLVRVWGTIGWIAAGWTFPMLWLQRDLGLQWMPPFLVGPEVGHVTARLVDSLKFSGVISFAYAAYCLTLPTTPPKRDATEPLAFAKAFRLLRRPSFAVLVVVGLAISAIHQVYFMQAAPYLSRVGLLDSEILPAMTIGQFSEILVMAFLGFFLKSFGFRRVVTLGALAYALRYAAWGQVELDPALIVASQALHGLCYACFFAASYIYVDRLAPADVRHSAQTVYGMIMLGGGPVLGGMLSGWLQERYQTDGRMLLEDFQPLWWTLAAVGLACAVAVFALFRDETRGEVRVLPEAESEAEVPL
jgi:nucleoside transporter